MVSIKVILAIACVVLGTAFAQEKCDAQITAFRNCRAELRQSTNDAFATQNQQAKSKQEHEAYYNRINTCFANYGCKFTQDSIAQLKDYDTCTTQMRTGARDYIQQCVRQKSGQSTFIMPLSRSAVKIQEIGSHELSAAMQFCQIQSGVSRRELLKCINGGPTTTTARPFFNWFQQQIDKASSLLKSASLIQGKDINMNTANELYGEFCNRQATCEAKVSETCNGAICGCIQAFNENKDLELAFRACLANEAEKENKEKELKIDVALMQNSIKTMRREMPQFCPGISDDYSYTNDEEDANKLCGTNCFQDVLYGDKFKTNCEATSPATPAGPPASTASILDFFGRVIGSNTPATTDIKNVFGSFFSKFTG